MLVEQLPLVVYVDAIDDAGSNIYSSPQVEDARVLAGGVAPRS